MEGLTDRIAALTEHNGELATNYVGLLDDLTAERAEIERLRAERDDHKQRLAIEAVTAPDADYDTMVDSLQARLRDLNAEVERLTADPTIYKHQCGHCRRMSPLPFLIPGHLLDGPS